MPDTLKDLDTDLVTTGSPVDGGCCYTSFKENPALPTDAVTKMSELEDFESLGELSENGYTEGHSVTTNEFEGWHGSTVLTCISKDKRTFKAEFIEPNRPSVSKLKHGEKNVETDEAGNVTHIKAVVGTDVQVPLVFDELESNGWLRRTVIKKANITDFDDVPHQKGSLLVYGMTFTAIDDEGFYDIYRAKPAVA